MAWFCWCCELFVVQGRITVRLIPVSVSDLWANLFGLTFLHLPSGRNSMNFNEARRFHVQCQRLTCRVDWAGLYTLFALRALLPSVYTPLSLEEIVDFCVRDWRFSLKLLRLKDVPWVGIRSFHRNFKWLPESAVKLMNPRDFGKPFVNLVCTRLQPRKWKALSWKREEWIANCFSTYFQ